MDFIVALVTKFTVKATTVVELSLNRFFKREYSSLFRAIGGYFTSRHNKEARTEERETKSGLSHIILKKRYKDFAKCCVEIPLEAYF